jgi:TRAP-type C4-dicarboxylate transport system permease small subunit
MKNMFLKLGAWLGSLPVLLLPTMALAQLSEAQTDLESVGGAIGTDATNNTLPELIGNIIAVLLSVLGIIFVVLVVYSGFLYLTSAGDDGKVKKAKTILSQSVIGLILIVAAYAIANFVIDALIDVAG